MSELDPKPLNWSPDPERGYTVSRRPDGGLHIIFTRVTPAILMHWRSFALDHLLNSDRLTRNLYDLRQIEHLPDEAVNFAVEVNSDPAVRNLRLAVIVSNEAVREAVLQIAALSSPGGVELGVFSEPQEAEHWLDRPLTLVA